MPDESVEVIFDVVARLEALGIPYVIGGSFASSAYGEFRASADVDLLIDLPAGRVPDLVRSLQGEYYVSEEAARDAARRCASFNAIHLRTMFKVDLFVKGDRILNERQLSRRVALEVGAPSRPVFVSSPEDTILCKLDWYRKGGGVSDRQWRDVIGVLKQQEKRLDLGYLKQVAAQIGLSELLERAIQESGLE